MILVLEFYGRVAKWLERLTAERNIDGPRLNPRIIVRTLAHCPPSSKWVPGGNPGEVKGGEERNRPPYLTMPAAQDKCPL